MAEEKNHSSTGDEGGCTGEDLALDRLCAAAPPDSEVVEIGETVVRRRGRQADAWHPRQPLQRFRATVLFRTGGQHGPDRVDTTSTTLEGAVQQMVDTLAERQEP